MTSPQYNKYKVFSFICQQNSRQECTCTFANSKLTTSLPAQMCFVHVKQAINVYNTYSLQESFYTVIHGLISTSLFIRSVSPIQDLAGQSGAPNAYRLVEACKGDSC